MNDEQIKTANEAKEKAMKHLEERIDFLREQKSIFDISERLNNVKSQIQMKGNDEDGED